MNLQELAGRVKDAVIPPRPEVTEARRLIQQYMSEVASAKGKEPYYFDYGIKTSDYPTGRAILGNEPLMQMEILREMCKIKPRYGSALFPLLTQLFSKKLPFSANDIENLLTEALTAAIGDPYFGQWDMMLRQVAYYVEENGDVKPFEATLTELRAIVRNHPRNSEILKVIIQIDEILYSGSYQRPEAGEVWSDKTLADLDQMAPEVQSSWGKLFSHALTAESGKPNTKWLAEAARYRKEIGEADFARHLASWLSLVVPPAAFNQVAPKYEGANVLNNAPIYAEYQRASAEYQAAHQEYMRRFSEKNSSLLKGLAWYAAYSDQSEVARGLAQMTQAAFTSIVGYGPMATRAGNAGIWALGQMPNGLGVGPLARLRTKLRDRGALKLIAAAMETAAKNAGMTVDELEDLAVPTGGLEPAGVRQEVFGDEGTATLSLEAGTGQTRIEWFGADGKPRKAVPAGVKREFGPEVKALKAAEEEIKQALSAQSARFDQFLLSERSWPLAVWRERYAAHPVLGNLARRLIWTFDGVAGLPTEETLNSLAETTEVRLWHPLGAEPEEVMRWRDTLEAQGIVQPFKQAHREVYLLTDAERTTRTYSNRFAAHILKQHQFNSLCILRGWKNSLRLMVDDEYPPATRDLPLHNLRAEFWVEGIGDDYGVDTNDAGTYLRLATDQVRFYHRDATGNSAHAGGGYSANSRTAAPEPIPLDQVPPLVLSEIMRDVDLFVGVSSVGNDPAWADGGPAGRFRDYWNDYAFGDLGESAKTRADVLGRLLPRLKIASRCQIDGKFLTVRGDLRTYKIHLGSGNILMEPNDQYLCIVPGRSEESTDLFLPFEGDRMLAIILSKAFLLAEDKAIKDPTIVSQIKRT